MRGHAQAVLGGQLPDGGGIIELDFRKRAVGVQVVLGGDSAGVGGVSNGTHIAVGEGEIFPEPLAIRGRFLLGGRAHQVVVGVGLSRSVSGRDSLQLPVGVVGIVGGQTPNYFFVC